LQQKKKTKRTKKATTKKGLNGITTTTMMNRSTTIEMSILLIQNLMTTMLTVRYSIIAMVGMAIDDVRYAIMTIAFHKLKFRIPPFDGKYDPNAYIS
jgi:hypothetical protein